jgi:hypothetical protein
MRRSPIPAVGSLIHAERIERALDPLAGAAVGRTRAWIGDWELVLNEEGSQYRTRSRPTPSTWTLRWCRPARPSSTAARASARRHRTRATRATTTAARNSPSAGVSASTGQTWRSRARLARPRVVERDHAGAGPRLGLDRHQPARRRLADGLSDAQGRRLAALGRRDAAEGTEPARILAPEQVRFLPGRRWQSPRTGAEYPVEWTLELDGRPSAWNL